ncbi:conserved hypothetical protein, partial [Ricinus communis]
MHRDEIKAAEQLTTLDQVPEKIQSIILTRSVYIPNAYETGYRIGALARRHGIQSAIVSFCHADEPHYYYLAKRYEPIVSKFLSADTKTYEEMQRRIPHRQAEM